MLQIMLLITLSETSPHESEVYNLSHMSFLQDSLQIYVKGQRSF